MSTATTRRPQDTTTTVTLYVAFELGERDWKLALSTGFGAMPRLVTIRARHTRRLESVIEQEQRRTSATRVVSCYEAGRDGFWLDRYLRAAGIDNRVVDAASIEVNRRARRAKTDRLDATKLLTMLLREAMGEEKVWSRVRVPSVEDEDARSLQREYRTLVKERTRSANRIRGLLASQGLTVGRLDGEFAMWLRRVRLWDGSPVPSGMQRRIEREFDRWQYTARQILDIEKERRERTKASPELEVVRRLHALKGIGLGAAWTFGLEFFSWRELRSAKQVGALAGLTPTPYQSGDSDREQGISRSGNRWVRGLAIEIAWGWLRHQPQSELARWYERRFGQAGPRARKVGIVALARKLLVALWRYVETGALPEGAMTKA